MVDSLSQALTTDDFCLSNLPEEPPSPSLNSSYFPNKVYGPLWSGAQTQTDAGRGCVSALAAKGKVRKEPRKGARSGGGGWLIGYLWVCVCNDGWVAVGSCAGTRTSFALFLIPPSSSSVSPA